MAPDNRRVLVTGARGFIGAHLVRRLTGLGARVHAVSRQAPDTATTSGGVTWWSCDLRDPDRTARLVRDVRPAAIAHLASEVAGARDHRLVLPMLRANLLAAVHLLSAAADLGDVRVVLANSIEEPPPGAAPSSPYAAAKSAATGYARMFHQLWGVPVTTLRIAMVYGPAQPDRAKLVPYVATSLLRGESPELTSGSREIDWVYVDDVVDAFVAALDAPAAPGAVLDIGSGRGVTIRDTVDLMVKLAGVDVQPRYGALPERVMDTARIADPSGAEAVLGWRARTPLDDGLSAVLDWYRMRGGPAEPAVS